MKSWQLLRRLRKIPAATHTPDRNAAIRSDLKGTWSSQILWRIISSDHKNSTITDINKHESRSRAPALSSSGWGKVDASDMRISTGGSSQCLLGKKSKHTHTHRHLYRPSIFWLRFLAKNRRVSTEKNRKTLHQPGIVWHKGKNRPVCRNLCLDRGDVLRKTKVKEIRQKMFYEE